MKRYWLSLSDPHEAVRGHGLAVLKITPETQRLFRLWHDCFHRLDELRDDLVELVVQDNRATVWYDAVAVEDDLYDEISCEGVAPVVGEADENNQQMPLDLGPHAHILKEGVFFTVYLGSDRVETSLVLNWDFLLKE